MACLLRFCTALLGFLICCSVINIVRILFLFFCVCLMYSHCVMDLQLCFWSLNCCMTLSVKQSSSLTILVKMPWWVEGPGTGPNQETSITLQTNSAVLYIMVNKLPSGFSLDILPGPLWFNLKKSYFGFDCSCCFHSCCIVGNDFTCWTWSCLSFTSCHIMPFLHQNISGVLLWFFYASLRNPLFSHGNHSLVLKYLTISGL